MSDPRKCNFVTTFGFNERLSSYAENPVNFLLKPLISRFLINRLKKLGVGQKFVKFLEWLLMRIYLKQVKK